METSTAVTSTAASTASSSNGTVERPQNLSSPSQTSVSAGQEKGQIARERKKSMKMSYIAKSLSSIFSSSKHSEEKTSPDKPGHTSPTSELPLSPTKELNLANISETDAETTPRRKESGGYVVSMSSSERRQSKVDANGLGLLRAADIEFENMLRNLLAQYSNKKSLPVLVDNDYNDYFIEGYAQLDRPNIEKSDESLAFDCIAEDEIVETSREYSYYSKLFQKKVLPLFAIVKCLLNWDDVILHLIFKEHFNFVGKFDMGLSKSNLFVLSVKYEPENVFACILRTKDGNFYEEFELKELFYKENNEPIDLEKVSVGLIMRKFNENIVIKEISPVNHPNASQYISSYDKPLLKQTFTFGVIYQMHGQVSEKEIFSNSENSKEFEEFLDFIGQRVQLKNFKKFRGGLDVIDGATGAQSVYEQHDNAEIMFHVSTFLPHSEKDQQYVERKRHIGNDRVAIVFQDRDTPFSPRIIKSKLLHVFMIVQPVLIDNETKRYKVSVISKKDVPHFEPIIRQPYIFEKDANLKNFLLSKLICAEYASLRAPAFSVYSEKTLESSLQKLYENLVLATRSFITSFSFSPSVASSSSGIVTDHSVSGGGGGGQLTSESASQISAASNSASSSGRLTVKGALRKFSHHYLKPENNPYLAADSHGNTTSRKSSQSAHREEDEEFVNRSKDSIKASKQGQSKYKKSASTKDKSSTSIDYLSDTSLNASASSATLTGKPSSVSDTTMIQASNGGNNRQKNKNQSESSDNLAEPSSSEYEDSVRRSAATNRRDTVSGVIVSGSGLLSATANSIGEINSVSKLAANESDVKIFVQRDSLENNFANTFNQELDKLNSTENKNNHQTSRQLLGRLAHSSADDSNDYDTGKESDDLEHHPASNSRY